MPSSTVHREGVLHQTESATVMLSAMIYPLWHWELLWQLAQPKLVVSLSLQVSAWYFRLPVFPGRVLLLLLPYTQTHFSFDSPLWTRATRSPVHPIPLLEERATHVQGVIYPSPVPASLFFPPIPPGVIQFLLLLHKPCLNPLGGRAEMAAPCFQACELEFLWAPLWSHFPWSFFSPSSSGSWDPHLSLPLPSSSSPFLLPPPLP